MNVLDINLIFHMFTSDFSSGFNVEFLKQELVVVSTKYLPKNIDFPNLQIGLNEFQKRAVSLNEIVLSARIKFIHE